MDGMSIVSFPDKLPDLASGKIVNGIESENSWMTEVQCALRAQNEDWEDAYYLSHECRKEHVPFSSAHEHGSSNIFMADRPHEFLTFSKNGRFYELASTEAAINKAILDGHDPIEVPAGHVFPAKSLSEWRSSVICPPAPVERQELSQLVNDLNTGAASIRELFLWTSFKIMGGTTYELCTPCRYLNFANTAKQSERYLQPISGQVLIPLGNVMVSGYIAIAMHESGEQIIEFAAPRYSNLFAHLAQIPGYTQEERRVLLQLGSVVPAYGKNFDYVVTAEGQGAIYRYGET